MFAVIFPVVTMFALKEPRSDTFKIAELLIVGVPVKLKLGRSDIFTILEPAIDGVPVNVGAYNLA